MQYRKFDGNGRVVTCTLNKPAKAAVLSPSVTQTLVGKANIVKQENDYLVDDIQQLPEDHTPTVVVTVAENKVSENNVSETTDNAAKLQALSQPTDGDFKGKNKRGNK